MRRQQSELKYKTTALVLLVPTPLHGVQLFSSSLELLWDKRCFELCPVALPFLFEDKSKGDHVANNDTDERTFGEWMSAI